VLNKVLITIFSEFFFFKVTFKKKNHEIMVCLFGSGGILLMYLYPMMT